MSDNKKILTLDISELSTGQIHRLKVAMLKNLDDSARDIKQDIVFYSEGETKEQMKAWANSALKLGYSINTQLKDYGN